MLPDGHSATSIADRLELSGPNLRYHRNRELVRQAGKTAETLDGRVRELKAKWRGVGQELAIPKNVRHFWPRGVTNVLAVLDQIAITDSIAASRVCDLLAISRSGFHSR